MISDFRAQGMHTILITDLHIKKDPNHGYAPTIRESERCVREDPDGSTYVGVVGRAQVCFLIYFVACADWWGGLTRDFVAYGRSGLLERYE